MPPVQILPAGKADPFAFANTQAAAGLLRILGEGERMRRDRALTDNILNIISEGADPQVTQQKISQALTESIAFSPGIQGVLQRLSGQFAGPSNVRQGLTGELLTQSLRGRKTPTIAQQRATQATKTGAVPGTAEFEKIAKGPSAPRPTKRTAADEILKIRDRKIKTGAIKEGSKADLALLGRGEKAAKTLEQQLTFWQTVRNKTLSSLTGLTLSDAAGETNPIAQKTRELAEKKINEIQTKLTGQIAAPTKEGTVRVADPNGITGSIPKNQLDEALKKGFTLVE